MFEVDRFSYGIRIPPAQQLLVEAKQVLDANLQRTLAQCVLEIRLSPNTIPHR
jgi:hypothetical protein